MGLIGDFFKKAKERKQRLIELEENDRAYSNMETKKKSHYERELIKIAENEKQEAFKDALLWENKRRAAEERLKARKMMTFNPEFFNDDSILKQQNLFKQNEDFLWR